MEISQGLRLCYKRFYNSMLLLFYASVAMQKKVIAVPLPLDMLSYALDLYKSK